MLKLASPMIVTTISFTVMQFVDRFMVSRLGTEELAAVMPAGLISFVPASFALGVMTTVNTFVSQSFGRGDKKGCSNYCWQAIYMGICYLGLMIGIMWPSAPMIFTKMGFAPEVVTMEVTYFRIMLYTQFLAVFIWSSSQFFMGIHRPAINMYAALVGQCVNILANYVLIFGKFGFPRMEIAGAGWGTFIGVGVGAAIRMGMFLSNDINRQFHSRTALHLSVRRIKDLVKVGFPAGFSFMINVTFLGMILLGLISKFGTEVVAATNAVFSCINLSVMPVVGLGTALTAAVGKSIGKGRKDIAAKQTSICLKVALCYMFTMGLCFFFFRNEIMKFWSPENDLVITAGMNILICAALFQVFDAAAITYNSALRGAGDTAWLAFVSTIGAGLILGLGGFLMVKFFPNLGALGPWMAFTADIIFVGIANRLRFKSNSWMQIDIFKRRPAAAAPVDTIVE
jgi:MATE family multidrug resistance protein